MKENSEPTKEKRSFLKKKYILWGIVVFFILILFSAYVFHKIASNLFFPEEYRAIVKKYSAEYEIDPLLVSAVIYTESHYDPSVVSPKGAIGLMQILPSTAGGIRKKEKLHPVTKEELKDPELNIKTGCRYLHYLLNKYDSDISTALAAYNAGFANVTRWKNQSNELEFDKVLASQGFKETKDYVYNVRKVHDLLIKLNLIMPL
ncbi:MAG: lytic transglycosylase domain-containing protein [Candidatus Aureabacteria bacterium]|nr:lytic transglycosylase domain-containing protein [Candidatus Auribacterota bacterium]